MIDDIELNNLIKMNNYALDLSKIKTLKIDFLFNYKELLKIRNLEELRFNSIEIEDELLEILNVLPNLKRLYFINCDIHNLDILNDKLELLYIERCMLSDVSEINKFTNLKSLSLVEMSEVDLNKISIIKKIENIDFMNSRIVNEDSFINLNKIIKLCISDTNVKNIDTLIGIDSLKKLVIDEDIYSSNLDVVNYLINKGIEITNKYGGSFGDING
ncbi:MAG: hypothetical protein IK997_05795 [Bacilli bacterium]|nr:hypothetical protein [Bacilli bacterium]